MVLPLVVMGKETAPSVWEADCSILPGGLSNETTRLLRERLVCRRSSLGRVTQTWAWAILHSHSLVI